MPKLRPLKYREAEVFIEERKAKTQIQKSALLKQVAEIIESRTSKKPNPTFFVDLPISREVMLKDIKMVSSGDMKSANRAFVTAVDLYPDIIWIFNSIRADNARNISQGEKALKAKSRGKKYTKSQIGFLNKPVRVSLEIMEEIDRVIRRVTTYPNAQWEVERGRHLKTLNQLKERFVVNGFVRDFDPRHKGYEEQYQNALKMVPFIESSQEAAREYEKLLPRLPEGNFNAEQVADIYLHMKENGFFARTAASIRKYALVARRNRMKISKKKSSRTAKTQKAQRQVELKEEKERRKAEMEFRTETKGFINWGAINAGDVREMRKAAKKLELRGLPIPDSWKPYLEKK